MPTLVRDIEAKSETLTDASTKFFSQEPEKKKQLRDPNDKEQDRGCIFA